MTRIWGDTRPVYYGSTAERAAFPDTGEASGALFWDYDDGTLYEWDGSTWRMTSVGYPFDVVTVDVDDANADYSSLEIAFSTEGSGVEYKLGPGTYTLTSTPMPSSSRVTSDVGSGTTGYTAITGYSSGGVSYGLTTDGSINAERVRINASATGGTDDAIALEGNGGRIIRCLIIATVGGGGTGDAFGVDVAAGVTMQVYGGEITATSSNNAYAIRVNAGATLYLRGLPVLTGSDGFFTGAGTVTGVFQDNGGTVYYVNGVANSTTPLEIGPTAVNLRGLADALVLSADGNDTLSAPTNGQWDFEVAGSDEAHLTAYGLSAQNFAFRVKNSSGGTVAIGDVGYIDSSGEYVETTTAYLDNTAWCVVVKGGADAADIYVAQRGRVTVTLDGNCSAGDYLYTSTTAGQATTETYVRPEIFAVALTANGAGAGGTCQALLLCNRKFVSTFPSAYLMRSANHDDYDFVATIATLPGGAVLTYNAPSSGDEATIRPNATDHLAKLRLYNSTRGTYGLIDDVDTGSNTITLTANVDAGWQVGDTLTARSQTCTNPTAPPYFYDFDLSSADNTIVPELAVGIEVEIESRESTTPANALAWLHTWETYAGGKVRLANPEVAAIYATRPINMPLFQRRFCALAGASGAGTAILGMKINGYWVAAP